MNAWRTSAEDAVVGLMTSSKANCIRVKSITRRGIERLRHVAVDQMRTKRVEVFPE